MFTIDLNFIIFSVQMQIGWLHQVYVCLEMC